MRIFGRDLVNEQNQPVKIPIKLAPIIFDKVYYQVKDVDDGTVIVKYGETDNSTRVSTDSEGMFFDFHMDILQADCTYAFEFLVVDRGRKHITTSNRLHFTVKN